MCRYVPTGCMWLIFSDFSLCWHVYPLLLTWGWGACLVQMDVMFECNLTHSGWITDYSACKSENIWTTKTLIALACMYTWCSVLRSSCTIQLSLYCQFSVLYIYRASHTIGRKVALAVCNCVLACAKIECFCGMVKTCKWCYDAVYH